ncbi:immunity protein 52 of polymorphic toxin system [Providencia alcalifaciens]|uniref:Immunity protein 52 of polymorphic toxin system n=1 Tax=Providencia alcalifaciens TaxID=126385 RepID=A0A4R3NJP0_9GAMM|nr:Imm52 family immunity protein [Providencia alcalifaciens]TCT34434.1 immunity protein 52 of polymorphic toxin system [Providencia alcalifaciens]
MDLSIKVDIELREEMSIPLLINIFEKMILTCENITNEKESSWYLTADTLEEALQKKAFNLYTPTDLLKNMPYFDWMESVWSNENKALDIKYTSSGLIYNLEFKLRDVNPPNQLRLIESLNYYIENYKIICIQIDVNGYWYNDKNVFPDRLPVGWMLYLNKKIMPEQVPMAAQLIHIDNEKNHGTLIISTDHVFDGENKDDIRKANEIEIQLAGLGLLPLIREIYS